MPLDQAANDRICYCFTDALSVHPLLLLSRIEAFLKNRAPPAGLEPAIFGLEVRRLVH